MFSLYPWFIPLAPLIAALFTTVPRRYLSDINTNIAWGTIFAGFVMSLLVLGHAIQNPEPIHWVLFPTGWDILPVVEMSIDRLSAVMMVVISGFATILYRYSTRYLQQDPGLGRYLTILALKISFQLFMVSCADLLTLFIAWQLISWFLSLLSHNYAHLPTAQGAFRTFIILRVGDLAFLSGITLAYHLFGTFQFAQFFERAALDQTHFALFGTGLDITGVTAVTLLIFIGVMCKSAQFPLHLWLPDSLYAPTPISALLHAGGINAGGFLLNRLAPLYILSPTTLHIALVVGLATAILGTGMMLVQNDIKKTLGYSTIGQMGYMIMECGLGAFSLAVFHLIAHGLFKANVFLNCGKGIHEARLNPRKPQQSSSAKIGLGSAFILSLIIPLGIAVGAQYVIGISFLHYQGLFILLLFSWITASQAMLTIFHLNKTILSKVSMLIGIGLVVTAYFFAAERFTHFLMPDSNLIAAYLKAAELPHSLFITLVALIVLSIAAAWFFSVYRQPNDTRGLLPAWLNEKAYLFLMNGLYLDGMTLRLFSTFKRIGRSVDRSAVALIVVVAISLVISAEQTAGVVALSPKMIVVLLASALLVPLFPFYGLYVAALTRAPGASATALCILLPVLGISAMTELLPEIPKALLPAIGVLAAVGAFWGSVKALMQVRVSCLLAYGGIALYSILWWHLAQTGKMTPSALLYAWTLTLIWGGLFFAWDRLRVRYGDLDLNQIGGLFQPMPRFAVCLGLLIMAAVGLPPFGLFFGYLGILLSPSTGISFGVVLIIATWFAACWYLFKLMQRLLFGPHRKELCYEDLRPAEIAIFVLVIALLVIPRGIPQDWLNAATTKLAWKTEAMP